MCQSLEGMIYVPRAHAESVWLLRTPFPRIAALSTSADCLRFQARWEQLHLVPPDVGACTHARRATRISGISQGDRPNYTDALNIGEMTPHHQFVIKT
jgi:hypothetical protein